MLDNARTHRWLSQRWIFDYSIALLGVEPFSGGSLTRAYEAAGSDIQEEARELRSRVKKFGDITRECKRIALNREMHANDAESGGHSVTARDNYFTAASMYGCARWPIWDDDDNELSELTAKVSECYRRYMSHSDHFIESIEIPFEGKKLYGYFHLPPNKVESAGSATQEASLQNGIKYPCVVSIPGMDTFKEELVRLHNDKFLQRGFAVLSIDGPGQGETLARGLKLTKDNYDRAGKVVMDFLLTYKPAKATDMILNPERIGIYAASFGSYWGPRIMANDSRYFAGTFTNICHEPRMNTIFNGTLPSFKPRHMWMTGIYDEDEFDKYRNELTLEGVGEKIVKPIFIAAGADDPLSPIQHTYDFYNHITSPSKRLLVYEGEEHRISDPLLPSRIGDFLEDVVSESKVEGGAYFLERTRGWRSLKPFVP